MNQGQRNEGQVTFVMISIRYGEDLFDELVVKARGVKKI